MKAMQFAVVVIAVLTFLAICSSPPASTKPLQQQDSISNPSSTISTTSIMSNTGYLGQNLNSLKDTNGKIVSSEKSNYKDTVEAYKIRYLSDGLEIAGFLLKPSQTNGEIPVIIWNRGGSREYSKNDASTLSWLCDQFVCQGYVVIASQYRGCDGSQGQDEYGGKDVDDVLNLIPLARSLPFISPNKIVMMGGSRWGMMTYISLTKTPEIKAAAVISGLADCIQNYNERESDMKNVYKELIGGSPIEKEFEFKMRSAVYWPEKINTPLLILHGDNDWRVNVSQAQDLANKLKSLGKTCELVIYPRGSHMVPEFWKDRDQAIANWFSKYLDL